MVIFIQYTEIFTQFLLEYIVYEVNLCLSLK